MLRGPLNTGDYIMLTVPGTYLSTNGDRVSMSPLHKFGRVVQHSPDHAFACYLIDPSPRALIKIIIMKIFPERLRSNVQIQWWDDSFIVHDRLL